MITHIFFHEIIRPGIHPHHYTDQLILEIPSQIGLTNTLNLTHRQRNSALEVLATPSLELKFNTTIKYDTIFNHPFHATTPSIVTTTTPAPFICIDFVYKFDRYTKQTLGFAAFYNPHTVLSYTCRFN